MSLTFALVLSSLLLAVQAIKFGIPVTPKAVFGFTDSLSDVGNLHLAMPGAFASSHPPYGKSMGGNITGRFSDGYLIIDFLAQYLGHKAEIPSLSVPLANATFQSICFGSAGTTVNPQDFPLANPFILPVQIQQFKQYKQSVLSTNPDSFVDFQNALYYIEIGGNDINFALKPINMTFEQVKALIVPKTVKGLVDGIVDLHKQGAVHFLIFNMPAAGCSPYYLKSYENYTGLTYDALGCLEEANDVVQLFNAMLAEAIAVLRCKYPLANFITYDFYGANIAILKNPELYAFTKLTEACCGYGGKYKCNGGVAGCGCGDVDKVGCKEPREYVSWDGIHYTQAFYQAVSKDILLYKAHLFPPSPIHLPLRSTCPPFSF